MTSNHPRRTFAATPRAAAKKGGAALRTLPIMAGAIALWACSGSDGSTDGTTAGGSAAAGTVTETWKDFCTITFTEETPILDAFGDVAFTAEVGAEYLLSDFNDFFGDPSPRILFLAPGGADEYEVPVDETRDPPYMSSCDPSAITDYHAVFDDVTVFEDVDLTTPLCDLAEGTAAASSGSFGFSTVGDTVSLSGPQTYEVYLGGLSEQCGGAELGYVSVPQVEVLGVTTWLVPFQQVLMPAMASAPTG